MYPTSFGNFANLMPQLQASLMSHLQGRITVTATSFQNLLDSLELVVSFERLVGFGIEWLVGL